MYILKYGYTFFIAICIYINIYLFFYIHKYLHISLFIAIHKYVNILLCIYCNFLQLLKIAFQ